MRIHLLLFRIWDTPVFKVPLNFWNPNESKIIDDSFVADKSKENIL